MKSYSRRRSGLGIVRRGSKSGMADARKAQQLVSQYLGKRPEFSGVGINSTPRGYELQVYLSRPFPKDVQIPREVLRFPVEVEVVGEVTAY